MKAPFDQYPVIYSNQDLELLQLPVLADNFIYILHDYRTQQTVVIDPAEAAPVIECLEFKGWKPDYIWNTHHHEDHIGGNLALKKRYNSRIFASSYDCHRIPGIDQTLDDGDQFQFGAFTVMLLGTPGHTLGHICYHLPGSNLLFCGDTLFALGCGRLFEGSPNQMWQSLEKIRNLASDTLICCTHEYTISNASFAASLPEYSLELAAYIERFKSLRAANLPTIPVRLQEEIRFNPFLQADQKCMQKALNMDGNSAIEVFAQLRSMKNNFKG